MFNLKLSKFKLIPVFAVAFCLAITSCTQEEIVPEITEEITETLSLKTKEANGGTNERASCGNFRNACYTRLGNVKVYLDYYADAPSDYRAGLVKSYFDDYVELLNDCIPGVNVSNLSLTNNICNQPPYVRNNKGVITNICQNSIDVFEYSACKIGNYLASGGSNPSSVEDIWENELMKAINCYASPPINWTLDLD